MPTTRKPTNANAIAAALRAAGFRPSPSARKYRHEGVFVSNRDFGVAVISVHIDTSSHRIQLAADMAVALCERGYVVETSAHPEASAITLYVRHQESPGEGN